MGGEGLDGGGVGLVREVRRRARDGRFGVEEEGDLVPYVAMMESAEETAGLAEVVGPADEAVSLSGRVDLEIVVVLVVDIIADRWRRDFVERSSGE